ncbi:MAG: hypothetical protein RLZZ283_414 [Candidatus Parcubacteria bacterium]
MTDRERAALKQAKKTKPQREAARLARKRERRLSKNLHKEYHRASLNLDTAIQIDKMIARGEKGFNGVDIIPMGVEKYQLKQATALNKFYAVQGGYDKHFAPDEDGDTY